MPSLKKATSKLFEPVENPRKAFYRNHQSWYRDRVLKVPAGEYREGYLGNLLPKEETKARKGLNFLDKTVTRYVEERVPEIQQAGGSVNVDRLWRNLLSSMPLCFNLFGYLRDHKNVAASVLSGALGLPIAEINEMEVEWAPPKKSDYLGDKTAFDTFISYRNSKGAPAFLGIETKYTEPFGRQRLGPGEKSYRKVAERTGILREIPSDSELEHQVWRNTLLAASVAKTERWGEGNSVVISLGDDVAALKDIARVRRKLRDTSFLRWTCYEALMAELEQTELTSFARRFGQRYLPDPHGAAPRKR